MYRSKHNDLLTVWIDNSMGFVSGQIMVWYNPSYGWSDAEDYQVTLQARYCLLPQSTFVSNSSYFAD